MRSAFKLRIRFSFKNLDKYLTCLDFHRVN